MKYTKLSLHLLSHHSIQMPKTGSIGSPCVSWIGVATSEKVDFEFHVTPKPSVQLPETMYQSIISFVQY